jgi:hypothetical protein
MAVKGRASMLYVVRYSGEPDTRWRALNARNADEARIQALSLSFGECVEYGAVDPDTGDIAILGTINARESGSSEIAAHFERPTGT